MKVQSPDIGWHGPKDRILSIDFHPFSDEFVSAGSDDKKYIEEEREGTQGCIKLWNITYDDKLTIKILYGLSQADSNTNVVKYSPNAVYLASGSDDKSITIWQKRQNSLSMHKVQRIIRWSIKAKLAGHSQDVLDLCWTKDSKYLISAGMDKRIFLFDVEKKYHVKVFDQHQKFVQGIAVDPKFQFIISSSNDRTSRVWTKIKSKKNQTAFYLKRSLKRYSQKKDQEEEIDKIQGCRLFINQSVPTFFRRPSISPDGQLFLFPAGQWQENSQQPFQYCAFIYRKNYLDKPTLCIPTQGQPVLVCKFCPQLFKKKSQSVGLFQQEYYMLFAIATSFSVLIYSTSQIDPLYGMGNYHYASITDLSWKNSSMLGISSSDGYCSFMIFQPGELGEAYEPQGELAELMHIPIPEQAKTEPNKVVVSQQQKVYFKETQNGIKKKIIPKKISAI